MPSFSIEYNINNCVHVSHQYWFFCVFCLLILSKNRIIRNCGITEHCGTRVKARSHIETELNYPVLRP